MQSVARQYTLVHFEDMDQFKRDGEWKRAILPEDVGGKEAWEVSRKLLILGARVEDPDLRRDVAIFKEAGMKIGLADNADASVIEHELAMEEFKEANDRIGQLLRA